MLGIVPLEGYVSNIYELVHGILTDLHWCSAVIPSLLLHLLQSYLSESFVDWMFRKYPTEISFYFLWAWDKHTRPNDYSSQGHGIR